MRKTGIFLLIMGLGSFILPMMGLQFKLMSIFGEMQPMIAGIAIVMGAVLTIFAEKLEKFAS